MSRKQKQAVALLNDWGYNAEPVGRHYVAAVYRHDEKRTPYIYVWCAIGIVEHARSGSQRGATWCPKHNPDGGA